MKAITVGELRKLLLQYPDHYAVATEGCDCIGPASGVSQKATSDLTDYGAPRGGCVIINRNDDLEY